MAEKQVGVRLAVIDGGKVKAELRSVGQEGGAALEKIRAATEPASAGLKAVNAAVADINGRVSGLAGNAGVIGSALSAVGPAGIIAAAAIAAVTAGISKGLSDFAEAEKVTQRLNAVLAGTGYAAGLTADQLDEFADAMELSTMATAEGVKGAAAILATFRSVSGETFTRTLTLAQDLSATFGGDLSSAATQLGKALEDPVDGISALSRVGVTFSASQKEIIKSLVNTGQQAQAQKLILDVLAQQVGGAGTAEQNSLAGSYKSAGDAVGNFLEEFVKISGTANLVRQALDGITASVNATTAAFLKQGDLAGRIVDVQTRLAEAESQLKEAQDRVESGSMGASQFAVVSLEGKVGSLKSDLSKLREEAASAQADADKAAKGQAQAQAEKATASASSGLAELKKLVDQFATPEEKIKKIKDYFDEIVSRVATLRANGADSGVLDDILKTATDYRTRAIAEIEKPGVEATNKLAEQNKALIDDLVTSVNLFGKSREEFVRKYVDRLGEGASAAEVKRVKDLAGALYDKQEAEKAAKEAADDHDKVMEDGKHTLEDVRTATEKYAAKVVELDAQLKAGAITQETYAKAVEKARREMEDHATDGVSGVRRALRKYAEESKDAAKQIEEATTSAFKAAEDALVEFATTGKLNVTDLVNSIIADLARLAIRQGITGPLSSALGSMFGGTFHTGGRVGESRSEGRELPAALWSMAPRAHTGARLLAPGEVPIVAQLGERVLNRQETQDYEAGRLGDVLSSRAQKISERLSMVVNVNGAAGNGEVVALVQQGISQALEKYDSTRARETAVEAVNAHRSRTTIGRLR